MSNKKVDIIIPIYNAYDDVVACLKSIYENTDIKNNRLILINDNSSDERMASYLDSQISENIIVIHNKSNLGFSNNINIGMSQSEKNDVILLNSDTVVTKGWVEKMVACAYSDESIGTVTPLSNNATLCSVPVFLEENKLPDGLSIDAAADIVEHCSMKKYPPISVAHGFCMLVKREVIEKVGYFDADTFGKGYGEENDFCNRAALLGYHHVMCDDTYIYHSGTKSFISKEKEKLIIEHDRILRDRYPSLMYANDYHCRNNPNAIVQDNVALHFDLYNYGKKNILYILQSDFREDSDNRYGGTQFHVHDLVEGLRDKFNVYVVARNGEFINLTVYYGDKEKRFHFYIGAIKDVYEFHNKKIYDLWNNIINSFQIDCVHIHHVVGLSFDAFYAAKDNGVTTYFTAHDFFMICPTKCLLDIDRKVCIDQKDMDYCKLCLKKKIEVSDKVNYIQNWREKCEEALALCDKIIVPEESDITIWNKFYPSLSDKMIVIEHGFTPHYRDINLENIIPQDIEYQIDSENPMAETLQITGWVRLEADSICNTDVYLELKNTDGDREVVPVTRSKITDIIIKENIDVIGFSAIIPYHIFNGEEITVAPIICRKDKRYVANKKYITQKKSKPSNNGINVAFIGGISEVKGGEEIAKLIRSMKKNINWYVIGGIGVGDLKYFKQKNYIQTDFYSPYDLKQLLIIHKIDIICILSVWPETYSYTMSEAIVNNIPFIVTDVGALGSRQKKYGCGWNVSVDSIVDDVRTILENVLKNQEILEKEKDKVLNISLKSLKNMICEYEALYNQVMNRLVPSRSYDNEMILMGCEDMMLGSPDTGFMESQLIYELKNELAAVYTSNVYKISMKLKQIYFPGKKYAVKFAKKIIKGR